MEETKTSGNRWNRTKKDWLEIWNKAHNNKFDYQLVPDFFLGKDRITVICPTHGHGILFKNKLELSRYLTCDRIMTFEELKEYRF